MIIRTQGIIPNQKWMSMISRNSLLLLLFTLIVCCDSSRSFLQNPIKGDIYLFEENGTYYPVMADKISGDSVFCVNSYFVFVGSAPSVEELPSEDFDFSYHLVYRKDELERLYSEKKIIRVIRNK